MNKLLVLLRRIPFARRRVARGPAVGVGTVQKVGNQRQVFIEVVAVSGETFVGKLAGCDRDEDLSMLRPDSSFWWRSIPLPARSFRCPVTCRPCWPSTRPGWRRSERYRAPSTAKVTSAPQYSGLAVPSPSRQRRICARCH